MAKIKSVSNYNGTSWDTPIPLGANDENIDITSATTDPTTDTTATAAGLIAADVVAGEGDTDATAWTKFNKFRRRVYNAFSGVAGVSVATSLVSSGGNSKVYSAGYINNYMTNVVGHSGTVTPTNGTIMDQLSTAFNFTNLTQLTPNPTTASYDLNTVTELGNYRGASDYTYSNAPITKKTAFTLRVMQSTGVKNSPYKWQIWINAYNDVTASSNWIFMRYTTDNGATWGLWRRIVFAHDLDNYVAKSGDTMTGDLSIDNKNAKITSTQITNNATPSEDYYGRGVYFYDTSEVELGALRPFTGATSTIAGLQGIQLTAARTISGTKTENYLRLGVDSSGNMAIRTPGAAAAQWRLALGLGTSTGAFPIQINQGGTGHTAVQAFSGSTVGASANSTNYTVNSITAKKWGKLCMLFLEVKANNGIAATTQAQIATLTSNFRPPSQAPAILIGASNEGFAYIEASGAVKVYLNTALGTNGRIYVQATYILA